MSRATRIRLVGAAVGMVLIAAACGGGGDSSSGSTPIDDENSVPADSPLEAFGDMVVVNTPAVSETFDAEGGVLELADGASVNVAEGAFAEQATITTEIFDLEFAKFADGVPSGRAYVVSTVDDIDLGAPVELEVPKPAATVSVTQYVDGQWKVVEVAEGPTTVVPIPHFSEVTTVIAEAGTASDVAATPVPDENIPAEFLTACVYTLYGMYSSEDTSTESVDNSLAADLALSVCTGALIDKFSPLGVSVSTECVGSKIGGDVDLQGAIDACVAAADEDGDADEGGAADVTTASTSNDQGQPTPDSSEIGDGVYVGEFDLDTLLADLGPEYLAAYESSANEVAVEVRDGELVLLEAKLYISNPVIDSADGLTCPSDDESDFSADPGEATTSGSTIELTVTHILRDRDLAAGDDCEDFAEDSTRQLPTTIEFDGDNATLRFFVESEVLPVELSRS